MKNIKRREFMKTAGAVAIGAGCLTMAIGKLHAEEKPDQAHKDKEFAPREKVEISGVYEVIHDNIDGDKHADQHRVIATAGDVFPHCKGCREWVRFRLSQEAAFIDKDPRFEK